MALLCMSASSPLNFKATCVRRVLKGLSRQLPLVLPHKLLPWMLELDMLPLPTDEELERYWNHLASRVGWASSHVAIHGPHFVPLWVWGDDAQYNKRNEKVVCLAIGGVLDERKHSVNITWPLCYYKQNPSRSGVANILILLQEESVAFETLNGFIKPVPCLNSYFRIEPLLVQVAVFLNTLFKNGAQMPRSKKKVHFCITEFRGDWKFHLVAWTHKNFKTFHGEASV